MASETRCAYLLGAGDLAPDDVVDVKHLRLARVYSYLREKGHEAPARSIVSDAPSPAALVACNQPGPWSDCRPSATALPVSSVETTTKSQWTPALSTPRSAATARA
jgi:hypothetical protein